MPFFIVEKSVVMVNNKLLNFSGVTNGHHEDAMMDKASLAGNILILTAYATRRTISWLDTKHIDQSYCSRTCARWAHHSKTGSQIICEPVFFDQ